jgi:hypothetical protein
VRRGGDQRRQRFLGGAAIAQELEAARAQARIGAVLRQDGAHAGLSEGHPRADRESGGGDGAAELPRANAMADEREGHGGCCGRACRAGKRDGGRRPRINPDSTRPGRVQYRDMEKIMLNERRRQARGRMITGGALERKAESIRCVVLDVSPTGARVHLLAPEPAPEVVLLHLPGGAVRAARRCWQRNGEAGYEFLAEEAVS